MVTKEELFEKLARYYNKLSLLFEKSKKNFCGSCHSCCTCVLTHGVCEIEYQYIDLFLEKNNRAGEGRAFRDYINKKRTMDGQLIYTGCPLYGDCGCSIYHVRPYSCRTYGLYGRVPVPPFCAFRDFTIIYKAKDFYNTVPLATEFFEIKSFYDILITDDLREKAEKYYNFALHLYYRGNMDEAEKNLKDALQADQSHSQAYYQLALIYYYKGNIFEASKLTEKALSLEPDNLTIKLKLGLFLTRLNENVTAKNIFLQILEKEPFNKMVLVALGHISLISGNCEDARLYCIKALEVDHQLEMALLMLKNISQMNSK
ncbi:MAG: tetratricopeptide repeat protein [Candidatus Eremiobacterota bacterium]